MSHQFNTPVALIIFNRPATPRRVFDAIRQARPQRLLVIADGPRPGRPGERELCTAVRAIVDQVNWPCDVQTNYSAVNLGCKRRVSSGLDWVFQTVEEAIVLEDDCLPHPGFFRYCAELLDRYRDDERVMHIGGANFQFGRRHGAASYYFSRYAHVWGWASWRRAWRHYDVALNCWPALKKEILSQFEKPSEAEFWRFVLDQVHQGKIDTWDYQWSLACMANRSLAAVPNVNLVSNIGFGAGATHTAEVGELADMPVNALELPIVHPECVARVNEADLRVQAIFFERKGLLRRLVARLGDMPARAYRRCVRGF